MKPGSVSRLLLLLGVLFVVGPVIVWPAAGAIVWAQQPTRDLDVFVFDLSVGDESYVEHASLALVLEYLHVPSGLDDYVGAAPGGLPHGVWPSDPPDVAILVDTYGVYVNGAGQVDDEGGYRVTPRLSVEEVGDLERWVDSGTMAMAEFNTAQWPTEYNATERLQALFSIDSLGWTGRTVADLATEVPERVRDLHPGEWDYSGPGIILLGGPVGDHVLDPQVVVLTADMLTGDEPVISGVLADDGRSFSAAYPGWFELVDPIGGASVDARLELPVTPEGAGLLEDSGIPTSFPMIVRTDRTVYLAGDLSENHVEFPTRRIAGSIWVMRRTPQALDAQVFYRVYAPMVAWLIGEAEGGAA